MVMANRRASALIATLFTITLCMVMLTLSMHLLSRHKTSELRMRDKFLARSSAASGIEYARSWSGRASQVQDLLTLNGKLKTLNEKQSFKLKARMMLGYLYVESEGRSGNQTYVMEALLGSEIYEDGDHALVVLDSIGLIATASL